MTRIAVDSNQGVNLPETKLRVRPALLTPMSTNGIDDCLRGK